jgi:hypothetical protein
MIIGVEKKIGAQRPRKARLSDPFPITQFAAIVEAYDHVHMNTNNFSQFQGGDVIVLEEAAYCDPGFFYGM